MIFSGVGEDIEHRSGVGILMNKEARRSLIEWSPISESIILGCFKTKIRNLTIIQCYAPTEMKDKNMEKKFYLQLHETIIAIQKKGCNHSDGSFIAIRELYNITRKLSQRKFRMNRPVRTNSGMLLTTQEEQLKRWEEHFSEIFKKMITE